MAITKETVVDKIEVLEMGQVQVRTATKIVEEKKRRRRFAVSYTHLTLPTILRV